MTSRHHRPEQPAPVQLTTRDKNVLRAVYRHRFLTADQLHGLCFAGAGLRVCQARLRQLWAGSCLDRSYLPPETLGVRDRWSGVALYSLALRGAGLLADDSNVDIDDIPHTPAQHRCSLDRMRHNLAATAFAVALELEAVRRGWTAMPTREDELRARLWSLRQKRKLPPALVPDGAVTLSGPAWQLPQTILVEVARAGAKAGNNSIRRKVQRYVAALRSGQLRDLYGFAWIRAIVYLTPTVRRAANLARLVRDVAGADRTFRFGVCELPPGQSLALQPFLAPSGATLPLLPELSIT